MLVIVSGWIKVLFTYLNYDYDHFMIIMDDIEDLVISFMIVFIVKLMAEYASSQRIREISQYRQLLFTRKCMVDGGVA